jgi:outer membrane protein TolC
MKQALRAAKGDRYPNFYLLGAYSMAGASDDLDFSSEEQATASSASIEVSFPFWTSGATTAKINQAKADYALARLELETLDEEIDRQVEAVRLDLESADRQVEANRKTAELAKRAFEIAETRYESGLLSQVELLDVNDTLTEARVNLLRSLFEALTAQARWERTVGIDWGESW